MTPFVLFPESLKNFLFDRGLLVPEPTVGAALSDSDAMRLAIQEAYRGLGMTSPNPLVGCVILDSQNKFICKGYHAKWGEGHAEANALKQLSHEQIRNCRMFVTLEPCAHEGKTPSCAKAIAKLPVKEVIYGLVDPNPQVSGQGAKILRDAGIRATLYSEIKGAKPLQMELEEVCEHFLFNFTHKKPFVSLKVATSLDGQMALSTGESKWITDETSREIGHLYRAAHDAVMVGSGTVFHDNPSLNIRHPQVQKRGKVIILDSQARLMARALDLQISKVHQPGDVLFVISDRLPMQSNPWGAGVLQAPMGPRGFNLQILLTKLWDLGIRSIFVEGGAQLLSSFIAEKAAQRLYLFQAPLILGAKSGKAWSEQVMIGSMQERISLKNHQVIALKNDILFNAILSQTGDLS